VRCFEAEVALVRERIARMHRLARARLPTSWRCVPLGSHSPDQVFPIVERFALMEALHFRRYWHSAEGFDRRISALLFEERN
jgi:hypothetical protein